jgi:membrane protease YdiL (CAAX protease family)
MIKTILSGYNLVIAFLVLEIILLSINKFIQYYILNKADSNAKYYLFAILEFFIINFIYAFESYRFLYTFRIFYDNNFFKTLSIVSNFIFNIVIIYFMINKDKEFINFTFKNFSMKSLLLSLIYGSIFIVYLVIIVVLDKRYNFSNEIKFKPRTIKYINDLNIIYLFYYYIMLAFIEEYLFRFLMEYRRLDYSILKLAKNKYSTNMIDIEINIKAWLVFSIIFGLLHFTDIIQDITSIIFFVLFSMYLYWFRYKTKNIYSCTLLHFLNNIIVFYILYR